MTATAGRERVSRGKVQHGAEASRTGSGLAVPRSNVLTILMGLGLIYCLLPLAWLAFSATKNSNGLFNSSGLWFAHDFSLFTNVRQVFTYQNSIYLRWFLNTIGYALVGAGGGALIATFGGYALAKYDFVGKNVIFATVIAGIAVPTTALAVPTYLVFSRIGLVNTPWAVILPSLVTPFGMFLMRVYASEALPDALLEAARIDGAGEVRIFLSVSSRQLVPGFVTVLLFQLVASWNNYFLPLIVLNNPKYFPLTVGLTYWNNQANGGDASSTQPIFPLVITGSLLAIIPLMCAFLLLQRYWRQGLSTGAVK